MADILFTHSYFLRHDPKEYRAMTPYPPLGTLYAAAAVRQSGRTVALFDAMLARSEWEITEAIDRHAPRTLVIYDDDFNYLTKMCLTRMREAAFRMASLARERGLRVIAHGSDATDHLAEYFAAGVQYVLIGEGEKALTELLAALDGTSTTRPEEIPGVALQNARGEIVRAPKREARRDLDTLPLAARDLADIDAYRRLWRERHGHFSLNIVTTRGCPFHCNWCAKPLHGQVYHSHSPQRIAVEMAEAKHRWGADHIWFCDDIFGLKPGWIAELADELERHDAHLPFKCLSRADLLLRGTTIDDLRRAGCRTVWLGAESGSQKILDAMDKGTRVEQIHEATARLKAAGIRVGFFLQFGYPGEEKEEIEATLRMVRETLPDEIGISVSYPLPGTPFYERVIADMGEQKNWSESADLAMMFRGAYGTAYYRVLSKYVHKEHRLRLGLQAATRIARDLRSLTPALLRRIVLTPYYAVMCGLHRRTLKRLDHAVDEPNSGTPSNGKSNGKSSTGVGSELLSTSS